MDRRPWRILTALIAAGVLLLTACGGDDGPGSASGDGSSEDAGALTDDGSGDEGDEGDDTAAPDGVRLLCDVNAPVEVDLDSTTDGEIVESDDPGDYTHCYVVEVPEGTGQLTVEITGLSDDLGVGVAHPDLDALRYQTGDYWRGAGEMGPVDEVVVIDGPAAGSYFIAVGPGTFQNESTYTLNISAS